MTQFHVRRGLALLSITVGAASCSSSSDSSQASGLAYDPAPQASPGGNASPADAPSASMGPGALAAESSEQGDFAGAPMNDEGQVSAPRAPEASASVRTNPFVMTSHDPLSTFAADVDTASYDLFQRMVREGALPRPEQVRLEEFVNYFRYAYPAADFEEVVPFAIHLAASPSFLEEQRTLLRVGIQGKAPPPEEKKPTNLVFLVDSSGSMQSADKLPLVQQVLQQTLDLLAPTDTISIVTYAGDTEVRLPPTPVENRAAIAEEIAGLQARGSTAGASGIELAYQQAEAAFLEGGVNHVILCTDGDFNVGVSNTEGLVELIEDKRRSGVTFTALGFGYSPNDEMLEAISNAGNGFYGVITSEDQAADYVHERMLSTLSLIAKDVKIQVEFNPEQVAAYRLLGYENRDIRDVDFRNDLVDAGEIGANHQVTALYELVLTGTELPSVPGAPDPEDGNAYEGLVEVPEQDLVLVKVRYKDVDATEQDAAFEVGASLAPVDIAASADDADLDLRWAAAVAAFSEILKGSPYAAPERMDALDAIFSAQVEVDEDRADFYSLFVEARSRM